MHRTAHCHVHLARLVGFLALLVFTTTLCGAAFGAESHFYSGVSFGSVGSGAGELSLLASRGPRTGAGNNHAGSGVAVDEATHDVYVADTENHRIDEFEVEGRPARPTGFHFVRAFGWEVDAAAPEAKLQICTTSTGCRIGASGSQPGEMEEPVYVAVDNDSSSASYGDVYVGDIGDGLISKFTGEGALVTSWGNNGTDGTANGQLTGAWTTFSSVDLSGIAVDGSGNLWLFRGGYEELFEFSQAGTATAPMCRPELGGADSVGLAVNPLSGTLYTGAAFRYITAIEPDCAKNGFVSVPDEGDEATGLAVDAESGDLYVDVEGERIDDFLDSECVPNPYGCAASEVIGEGVLDEAAGLAVDAGSGVLYAVDVGSDRIDTFPVGLSASDEPASEVGAHEAVLRGLVNPYGAELSSCVFEYGEGETIESQVPCEESTSSIGSGISPVAVQAKVSDLEGGAGYRFRLRAVNETGDVRSEMGSFRTSILAKIESASSETKLEEDGDVSTEVNASVDTNGVASTTCEIEYGTSVSYGVSVPCAPEALSNGADVQVSAQLPGLAQQTGYHWRLKVSDANGTEYSPDQTFVYLPGPVIQHGCENEAVRGESDINPHSGIPLSLDLPDCRGYEMVTPAVKNGALLNNALGTLQPTFAADGSRAVIMSTQCFASAVSCDPVRQSLGVPFSFERGTNGWAVEPWAPPLEGTAGDAVLSYNVNNGMALFALAGREGAAEQFYVRQPDGALTEIGPLAEQSSATIDETQSDPINVTSDFSTIVYEAGTVWPSLGNGYLYEYSGAGQAHPTLVGVSGGQGSTSLISACRTLLGSATADRDGALSADGQVVFFTALSCPTGTGTNVGVSVPAATLYARVGGSRTVLVSGSANAQDCDAACQKEPPADANFQGASSDASRVFFTSTRQLTDEANEDSHVGDTALNCTAIAVSDGGCNLYMFECPRDCENEAEKQLVDVSMSAIDGEAPGVQGVVALSSDGSHVYFIAKGTLTNGANGEGHEPLAGAENMYMYERDSEHPEGHLAFIATLSKSDSEVYLKRREANVTPDGRFLVFLSHRGLTPDARRGEGPAQVYRYDAQSEHLERISIGQQGYDDNGNDGVGDANIVSAINGFSLNSNIGRSDPTMADDGSRIFFESPIGLAPDALNDQPMPGEPHQFAQNIYEWEQSGSDGCVQPEGCVALISDGLDTHKAAHGSAVLLLGSDASGDNVFFETADQLVPQDDNSAVDVYDARVDGGFPAPASPSVCEPETVLVGETCRHSTSEPSIFTTPASLAFSGPENPPSPPAGKPKHKADKRRVKSHGKHRHRKQRASRPRKRHAKHERDGKTGKRAKSGSGRR